MKATIMAKPPHIMTKMAKEPMMTSHTRAENHRMQGGLRTIGTNPAAGHLMIGSKNRSHDNLQNIHGNS